MGATSNLVGAWLVPGDFTVHNTPPLEHWTKLPSRRAPYLYVVFHTNVSKLEIGQRSRPFFSSLQQTTHHAQLTSHESWHELESWSTSCHVISFSALQYFNFNIIKVHLQVDRWATDVLYFQLQHLPQPAAYVVATSSLQTPQTLRRCVHWTRPTCCINSSPLFLLAHSFWVKCYNHPVQIFLWIVFRLSW